MTGPDYIVDIHGIRASSQREQDGPESNKLFGRPWLAIHWRCCGVYSRIYRNAQATAYEGRCPRCRRAVTVRVGPGGTSARFFEAR